jgi:streptogramin lyase
MVPFHGALYLQGIDTITRMTTGGKFTHTFKMPHGGRVADIAPGPGGTLWFAEHTGAAFDYVGWLTPGGHMQEYPVATNYGGVGYLCAAGDGNLYVRQGDYMTGIHPDGQVFASQYLGFIAGGGSLVEGSDGNIWYSEGVLDRIGVAHVVR